MKSTTLTTENATYALGAYYFHGKLFSVMVAEVGRTAHTPTSGARASQLDELISAPQTADSPDLDFDGRSIIGPASVNARHPLGGQFCFPSVRTEDADEVIAAIRRFAAEATDGVGPDEWASLVGGAKMALNIA